MILLLPFNNNMNFQKEKLQIQNRFEIKTSKKEGD